MDGWMVLKLVVVWCGVVFVVVLFLFFFFFFCAQRRRGNGTLCVCVCVCVCVLQRTGFWFLPALLLVAVVTYVRTYVHSCHVLLFFFPFLCRTWRAVRERGQA